MTYLKKHDDASRTVDGKRQLGVSDNFKSKALLMCCEVSFTLKPPLEAAIGFSSVTNS